jgi:RNA polymerase sigma-70 factor, ECF subfamily
MAEPDAGAAAAGGDSPERRARETAWLQQIAQRGTTGSRALRQLINVYGPKVLTFCMRRGMSRADVEDLLQDLWTRVSAHAADFEPGRTPSTWIWAIARNLWRDAMRRLYKRRADNGGQEPESLSEVADAVAAPNCTVPGESVDECVQRGLQRYAFAHDEGAVAVQLRDLEGWGVAEVAQFLGRTEGATRTFLSQVRKGLEPFLKPCFELLSN